MYALGGVRKEPVDDGADQLKTLVQTPWLDSKSGAIAPVTQIVGHGDETEARDVGIVAGLVELLLRRVVTVEPLCSFWQVIRTEQV